MSFLIILLFSINSQRSERFVDRDMFMCYLGGGVGHVGGGAQRYFQGATDTSWAEECRRQTSILSQETLEPEDPDNADVMLGEAAELEPESEEDTNNEVASDADSDYEPSFDGSDYEDDLAHGLD